MPKAQRSRTANSASHPRISREDSGYSSLAESDSKQSEPEQTRVKKKGVASISFVREFSETQKEYHYQQNEITHAEATSSSSATVTRLRSTKASVQVSNLTVKYENSGLLKLALEALYIHKIGTGNRNRW